MTHAADANKTQLTHDVTRAAVEWLESRGFKPVESEVQLDDNWIADLATFSYPTRTEAQHMRLIPRRPVYQFQKQDEWNAADKLWNSQFKSLPAPITALVEVKTTRADFTRDDKFNRQPSPVNLLFLAVPAKLVASAEVNERWGIIQLEVSGIMRCVRWPKLQECDVYDRIATVAAIAIRRDHFTRYQRFREFERQSRERSNERVNRKRLAAAIEIVSAVQGGQYTVDQAVAMFGGREKLPKHAIDKLERMVPCAVPAEKREAM